jgi:hypothetical protein
MSGSSVANPQIPYGTLNRVRGQIQVPSYPALTVTAPFMGERGYSISRATPGTTMLNQLLGRVVSPEPYQAVTIEAHLAKSQTLAQQWENQLQSLSAIGQIVCFTDSMNLGPYTFINCAIENVDPIENSGKSAEYMVRIMGTYIINNALFQLTI